MRLLEVEKLSVATTKIAPARRPHHANSDLGVQRALYHPQVFSDSIRSNSCSVADVALDVRHSRKNQSAFFSVAIYSSVVKISVKPHRKNLALVTAKNMSILADWNNASEVRVNLLKVRPYRVPSPDCKLGALTLCLDRVEAVQHDHSSSLDYKRPLDAQRPDAAVSTIEFTINTNL